MTWIPHCLRLFRIRRCSRPFSCCECILRGVSATSASAAPAGTPKTLIAKQLDVHAQSDCKAQTAAANPSANGPFALDPQRVPIGLVELFFGNLHPACMPLLLSSIIDDWREDLLHFD